MSKTTPTMETKARSTEITRFNALRHGVLSRYTVLPWEDAIEYDILLAALAAEHAPQGPTEEHLVEELAGILWRKRRLRLAEAAAHRRGLDRALETYRNTAAVAVVHLGPSARAEKAADAVCATDSDTQADTADIQEDEAMTRRALDLLASRRNDAYEAALAALRHDTQDWWAESLESNSEDLKNGEAADIANAEGLRNFLQGEVLPWFDDRKKELTNRLLIREQAFGEALDPDKLERLVRYEVHLDRKLERTLSMLIKLRDLRQATVAD